MPTATIIPQYVNQPKPGARSGSVKDGDGNYWSVDPRDLSMFTVGQPATIDYLEQAGKDGRIWKNIKRVHGETSNGQYPPSAPQLQPQKPVGNGVGFRQVTLEDDLRMLRNAWGKAFIQASPERFDAPGAFTDLYMRLRKELSDAAVRTTSPQRRDDMADEIPY